MELYYVITISDRDRAEILANIYQTAGTGMVLTKLGIAGACVFCFDLRT